MASPFEYCPHADAVMARLRTLYLDRPRDQVFASMAVPSPALDAFAATHSAEACEYPDPSERVRFWDSYLAERAVVEDDSLPTAYCSEFDQGVYGGVLGGDVTFVCDPATGWISSMVAPLLDDLARFESLALDEDHAWFRRFVTQLDAFAEAARGRFGVSHFILINQLNFLFELVGATQAYMEMIERPDLARRAMAFGLEVNLVIQNAYFERVGLVEGGTCSNMTQWTPGRIVSESIDPFHMASVDYFEEHGRAIVEHTLAQFDGGATHVHGNGRHLLEAASSIKGLKALYLGDDRGFPLAFDVLPEIRSRTGDVPLVVMTPYEPFKKALDAHALTGGVFYVVSDAPDVAVANRTMEAVRAYRV